MTPAAALPNPHYAFTKALGAIRSTLDTQGTVGYVPSSVDL